jgi:hypothetical protein
MRWTVLLVAALSTAQSQAVPPTFEAYPASETFKGPPAAPRLNSASARMFRTELRRQAATGPNFAGHFTFAIWGCGSGCSSFAVLDAVTGQVTFPTFSSEDGRTDGRTTCHRTLDYRLTSTLLVVSGNVDGVVGTHYFNWSNGAFTKVFLDKAPTDLCTP